MLDAPVVLAGDYNVVPTNADIYPTKSYKNNALVQPQPRVLFRRLLNQGWIDAVRRLHPDAPMYTDVACIQQLKATDSEDSPEHTKAGAEYEARDGAYATALPAAVAGP